MNVIIALSPFTLENGATNVVPKSHQFDYYPDSSKSYPTLQAAMPKGSAVFVLGSTFHGGGANKTANEIRHGVTMAFVPYWIRPQENFMLSVSQEKAATFDPELQKLMGYQIGRKRLGHIYAGKEHVFTGPLAHKVALHWETDSDTDKQYQPKTKM